MTADSSHYLFKHHPETCDPDDVWGQVKRTVKGKPVSSDQIALIVSAISSGLVLQGCDRLLDLCCGNGALTTELFGLCNGGLGVDYSGFLIEVAQRLFLRRSTEAYLMADALDYLATETRPQDCTKVLCYGAFPYFDPSVAEQMLRLLHTRFLQATHVFLGQLPDKSRMRAYYTDREPAPGEADDPGGLMGIWRTPQELEALAGRAGWHVECRRMPTDFYATHYRYDAVLTRA